MRYATDVFTFGAKGLAYCKTAFDFTACNKINSISVTGTESEDDNRGFVFHTGGKYYVLDDNGNLVEISVGTGTDNITRAVLSGNSAAQLNALTNVTSLAGKSVNLYIALSCPADATSKPSAKIAFVGAKVNRTLVKNVEFAAKTFNDKIRLTAVTPTITKTGNASATLQVKLLQDGAWTDYKSVADSLNQFCTGYQVRAVLAVTEINGADSVGVSSLSVAYKKGGVL